jgi:hypothetical protein
MVGTMTAIGLALAAGGAATSAVGQVRAGRAAREAGKAQQAQYEANAQVAESQAAQLDYNAKVAEEQAADAITRGQEEESRFRTSVRGLIGSQRAGFAGQGVVVDAGSAADVRADTTYLGERDALTIRHNAAREAWGYQTQAEDLRQGAAIARKGAAAARVGGTYAAAAGRAAQTQARIGAATSILGTGSSLVLDRYGWARGSR